MLGLDLESSAVSRVLKKIHKKLNGSDLLLKPVKDYRNDKEQLTNHVFDSWQVIDRFLAKIETSVLVQWTGSFGLSSAMKDR